VHVMSWEDLVGAVVIPKAKEHSKEGVQEFHDRRYDNGWIIFVETCYKYSN
jgi:hypothetical protein